MTLNAENLYRQMGRLLETMPNLNPYPLPTEAQQWLGRADALVKESGDLRDSVDWRVTMGTFNTGSRETRIQQLKEILYRVLASAELRAPASARGAFIPAGSSFDAFAAVSKVLQSAAREVFIVDPYMDESALTEFGQAVPAGVSLRLMADDKNHKPTLPPAAQRWAAQHGAKRPLAVRLAPPRSLHDRAIFIDGTTAWALTQSLRDFAKRAPAEIVRADDTAALKIAAYEAIWQAARVVM
jgi:phosphatidylserine/phosphatidylglycerophosphate/cardiolipin synthase-like enzyme